MEKKKYSGIIIFCVTIILLVIVLKDNFLATVKILKNMNILLFMLSILTYAGLFTLEALIFKELVREYKYKYKFKEAMKLSVVTRFFNGITPFSSGGRPLQVYELKKSGLSYSEGTNVIVQNFLIFQIAIIIFSIFSLTLNKVFNIFSVDSFLYNITVLCFIINIIIFAAAIFFSINKNINKKITNFVVDTGSKIKLVKDKETLGTKFGNFCDSYYSAFKDFKHKYKLIIKCVIFEIIALIFYFITIYVVFLSLNLSAKAVDIIPMIIGSNLVFLAGSFVPIPGGSGGMEYSYAGYFTKFTKGAGLSSSLIIWRFVTYYFPTLLGAIVFSIDKKKDEKNMEDKNE